jgi:hypothetical protein
MDNNYFCVAQSHVVEREVKPGNTLRNARPDLEADVPGAIEERQGQAYPKGSRHSVKHIAFLYAYQKKHPLDIVARYPRTISHAQVHIALAHYYLNQEAVDAQIERELKLNRNDALSGNALDVPHLRLDALVEVGQEIDALEAQVSLRASSLEAGTLLQSHCRSHVKTSK